MNDAFWGVIPNVDIEVHTTTYTLSHLGSIVKQTTLLSNPTSTVKRTTCCHVPEVPSNKLHCCRVPEVSSNDIHCCRVPEVPWNKLHAVAPHKYRQSNYMLSNPRSTVKEITFCHIPVVPSKKLHAVTSQKYRQTNYMFHIPEVSNIHIYLWLDMKYFQILFQIMFPFRAYFEKRILYPSRFYFPCSCLQLSRRSKLFHTKSLGLFVIISTKLTMSSSSGS